MQFLPKLTSRCQIEIAACLRYKKAEKKILVYLAEIGLLYSQVSISVLPNPGWFGQMPRRLLTWSTGDSVFFNLKREGSRLRLKQPWSILDCGITDVFGPLLSSRWLMPTWVPFESCSSNFVRKIPLYSQMILPTTAAFISHIWTLSLG